MERLNTAETDLKGERDCWEQCWETWLNLLEEHIARPRTLVINRKNPHLGSQEWLTVRTFQNCSLWFSALLKTLAIAQAIFLG